ncbi:hypothetical protein GCM10022226_55760 [Sphaerisporangium flaviroseum]|uniref:HTH luxR-type domain-containing protein n=1 Tax=Sphaerisporangium flaviroseum TaxID=509199 RepID=A0ABP7IW00_9ACTN
MLGQFGCYGGEGAGVGRAAVDHQQGWPGASRLNAEIARRLHLSKATVKGHVSRILVKLDCPNRTRAGLLAQHAMRG